MNLMELTFNHDDLYLGIEKISSAVKSTLGPMGRTVLIESANHTRGVVITKDGVTVAKSIALSHPVQNLAVSIMKEAADRTAVSAGDGTTTAIVLTEAIINASKAYPDGSDTETLREIKKIGDMVCEELDKKSIPLDDEMMRGVAEISANNDVYVGSIISDAYRQCSVVTADRSDTSETYSQVVSGLKIDRGYTSHLFINNHKKDECVMEDTMVLLSDIEITSVNDIEDVLKYVVNNKKRLLIVAPCSQNMLGALAMNVAKNVVSLCVIQPPHFGYKQHELMQDIAIATGGVFFSEKTGDNLKLIRPSDLGHADKVVVNQKETVLLGNKAGEEVKTRIDELKDSLSLTKKKNDKEFIMSRIARLQGKVGVVYVGGETDIEQKELYDRVDDAICAVQSAVEEGVVPGGGRALAQIKIDKNTTAGKIMAKALMAPYEQILVNAGEDPRDIDINRCFNVKTGEYVEDFVKSNVIDPVKVTKAALKNAISVASTILSTKAILTIERDESSK